MHREGATQSTFHGRAFDSTTAQMRSCIIPPSCAAPHPLQCPWYAFFKKNLFLPHLHLMIGFEQVGPQEGGGGTGSAGPPPPGVGPSGAQGFLHFRCEGLYFFDPKMPQGSDSRTPTSSVRHPLGGWVGAPPAPSLHTKDPTPNACTPPREPPSEPAWVAHLCGWRGGLHQHQCQTRGLSYPAGELRALGVIVVLSLSLLETADSPLQE